ncbi:unnamed protein product, partial [Mesorhabditis belari]|uniref:Uncharacterized protein n=1 Tax=Mesorhabditis belari TaxID=2138241 RepID=A0AAF3EFM0_9BILA
MTAGDVITQIPRDDFEHEDYVTPATKLNGKRKKKKDKEKSRQSNSSRSKPPRWGRWMQSFCCCMAPQQEIEPVRTNRGPLVPVIGGPSAAPTSPTPQKPTTLPTASITPASQHRNSKGFESLITQVNKDGTITVPLPTEQQKSESASIIKAHQQAHQLSPNGSPVAQVSQGSLQSFFENLRTKGGAEQMCWFFVWLNFTF